jgi:energy-coupling factor transporter transmembrane protein EcfT
MLKLHPAVSIYIWACLLAAAQMMQPYPLFALAVLVTLYAFVVCPRRFIVLLKRTRWILLALLFIYAYTGQGAALCPQCGVFSPVAEGVREGALQIMRLLLTLAGLSVLLSMLTLTQFVSGLYTLLFPLTGLGLEREKLAVRLALTLHYAESMARKKPGKLRDIIGRLAVPAAAEMSSVTLQVQRMHWLDWVLVLFSSALILGLWL